MRYTLEDNTILDYGFPMALGQVVSLLNSPISVLPVKEDEEYRFAEWWALYPRKTAKPNAKKAWVKNFINDKYVAEHVISRLKKQIKDKDVIFQCDKEWMPHPATYLNGGYYDNEIIVKKENKKEWLSDEQVNAMGRSGESYVDLFARLSAQGYNFNKNRS